MGRAGLRAAQRRPGAVPVNPASRKTATAVFRTADITWADVPARGRLTRLAPAHLDELQQLAPVLDQLVARWNSYRG